MHIEWDRWGVPTITGDSDVEICHGMGRAQAIAHATEVLEVYGVARGTAASMWGPAFLPQDRTHAQLGLADLVERHWADQTPETIERIQAFCDGFNAACEELPTRGTTRREALPVTPRDVIAHGARIFTSFATMADTRQLALALGGVTAPAGGVATAGPAAAGPASTPGSNGWAVSAAKSTTGGSMLIINPHLLWSGFHRFFEARSISPGRDVHGTTLIGIPWQTMGFNDAVAWGHTVPPAPLLTVYELDVEGDTYLFDGERRPFEVREHVVAVAGGEDEVVVERRSVHGPVVTAPDGAVVAIRAAGVFQEPTTTALEAWWDMGDAASVDQLVDILEHNPLPKFNTIAADRAGNIAAIYCARPPKRSHGTYEEWTARRVPGDDPAWLWDELHAPKELPRVVNPACGWVQNQNEAPWWYAEPPLDPATFPNAIAPPPTVFPDERSHASRSYLRERDRISPEELLALKWGERVVMADAILDDLLAAAEVHADLEEAVRVLRAWDRQAGTTSAGYVLFELAMMACAAGLVEERTMLAPADPPGGLPSLADAEMAVNGLRVAVMALTALGAPLDVPFGVIAEMREGQTAVPAAGGSSLGGVFKTSVVVPGTAPEGGKLPVAFGDTWIAMVQFPPDGPPTVDGLMVYGNATEPGAPAADPQIGLFAASQLRRIR